jgi:hypothetical protein
MVIAWMGIGHDGLPEYIFGWAQSADPAIDHLKDDV